MLSSGPSELPLVQQLPEPITDLAKVLSEARPIEGREQAWVREVIEHPADAAVGLGCEVVLHQLQKHVSALGQQAGQHSSLEGEGHLAKAECRHGALPQLLAEAGRQAQFTGAKAAAAVQHRHLDSHLDQVLDDSLGLRTAARVLLGHTIELIQHLTACLIDEEVSHRPACHLTQQLLLCLQGQAP